MVDTFKKRVGAGASDDDAKIILGLLAIVLIVGLVAKELAGG